MKYDNLFKIMLERFPHFNNLYKQKDVEFGLYVVFGLAIMPSVIDTLKKHDENKELLFDLFNFFEQMANSDVEEIRELLMYSVLENLGDDKEILSISQNYMGDETKRLSNAVENFLGR